MLYRKMTPEDWKIGTTYFVVYPGSGKQNHGKYGPYGPRELYRIVDLRRPTTLSIASEEDREFYKIAVLSLNVIENASVDLSEIIKEVKESPSKRAYGWVSNNDVCGWALMIHKVKKLGDIPNEEHRERSLSSNNTVQIQEWTNAGYRDLGWFPSNDAEGQSEARRVFKAEAYVLIDGPQQLSLFNMIT